MKHFILGFTLACAMSSWAVVRHDDGSLTFDREEVDALRLQFYSLKATLDNCSIRVQELQEENKALNKTLDRTRT